MSQPYYITENEITIYLQDSELVVNRTNPNYNQIVTSLRTGVSDEELQNLANPRETLKVFTDKIPDKFVIESDAVYYDGIALSGNIVDEILRRARNNLTFSHLLKFFENLSKNPSYASRESLFDFLALREFPFSTEGTFYAYKAVRKDFKDKWSGTLDNSPGNEVSFDRSQVNSDRGNACASGLHAGNKSYVDWYGTKEGKLVIVEINPEDVVMVPKSEAEKIRVCKYKVLAEVSTDFVLDPQQVYISGSLKPLDDAPDLENPHINLTNKPKTYFSLTETFKKLTQRN